MNETDEIHWLKAQWETMQSQLAFQEDTIQTLNEVIIRQQQQIEHLNECSIAQKFQLDHLTNTSPDTESANTTDFEKPPHY